ncbi:MAG: hypothetical protein MMC33_003629 [Icmadophila ericetorum]|nr:hypothetical protein [Icmadophila ericetorum]
MRRANSDKSFLSRIVGDFKQDFISGVEDLNHNVDNLGNKLETFTQRFRSKTESFENKLDNLNRKWNNNFDAQVNIRVDNFENKIGSVWNKISSSMGSNSSKPSRPKISAPLGPARNHPHFSRPFPLPPMPKPTKVKAGKVEQRRVTPRQSQRAEVVSAYSIPPPLEQMPPIKRRAEVKRAEPIRVEQERIQSHAGSIMGGSQRDTQMGRVKSLKAEEGRVGRIQSQKAVMSYASTSPSSSYYGTRHGSYQSIPPPPPLKDSKSSRLYRICGENPEGKGSGPCKQCATKLRDEHLSKASSSRQHTSGLEPFGGTMRKCVICWETPEVPGRGCCQKCGEKKGRVKVQTSKRQCGHCWNVRELNGKGICDDCTKKAKKTAQVSGSKSSPRAPASNYSTTGSTNNRLSRPPDFPDFPAFSPPLKDNVHAGVSSNLGGLSDRINLPDMPAFYQDSVLSRDWSEFSKVSAIPAPLNIRKQSKHNNEPRNRANTLSPMEALKNDPERRRQMVRAITDNQIIEDMCYADVTLFRCGHTQLNEFDPCEDVEQSNHQAETKTTQAAAPCRNCQVSPPSRHAHPVFIGPGRRGAIDHGEPHSRLVQALENDSLELALDYGLDSLQQQQPSATQRQNPAYQQHDDSEQRQVASQQEGAEGRRHARGDAIRLAHNTLPRNLVIFADRAVQNEEELNFYLANIPRHFQFAELNQIQRAAMIYLHWIHTVTELIYQLDGYSTVSQQTWPFSIPGSERDPLGFRFMNDDERQQTLERLTPAARTLLHEFLPMIPQVQNNVNGGTRQPRRHGESAGLPNGLPQANGGQTAQFNPYAHTNGHTSGIFDYNHADRRWPQPPRSISFREPAGRPAGLAPPRPLPPLLIPRNNSPAGHATYRPPTGYRPNRPPSPFPRASGNAQARQYDQRDPFAINTPPNRFVRENGAAEPNRHIQFHPHSLYDLTGGLGPPNNTPEISPLTENAQPNPFARANGTPQPNLHAHANGHLEHPGSPESLG